MSHYFKKSTNFRQVAISWLMLWCCALLSTSASSDLTFSDISVSDVSPNSFTVNWQAEQAATGTLNIFRDVNASQPVSGITVTPQFTISSSPALGTLAEDNGVLRVRVTGLAANMGYFFQLVTTHKATGVASLFPSGGALPSVKTPAKSFPVSNENVGADVFQPNGVTAATGSILTLTVAGSPYAVSHMTGDGFASAFTAVNLTNLFDSASISNRAINGGESVTVKVFGGLLGSASALVALPANGGQGALKVISASPITLQPKTDSDADLMPDAFEIENALVVGANDSGGDPDADNLSNLEEYRKGTNPHIADSDGDGINDGDEVNLYLTLPTQADTDQDGIADGAEIGTSGTDPLDADSDDDGVNDGLEITLGGDPNDPGNTPVLDSDSDTVPDSGDNCPTLPNPGQTDTDNDGAGDVCDSDDDNDSIADGLDNSPLNANPGQEDGDNDGIGDASDNCALVANTSQADNENDGLGDICDPDDDNDGVKDVADPGPPSALPFYITSINSFVATSFPVTAQTNAFVSVGKYDITTATLVSIGFFNLSTREYTPQSLTPEQAALTGVLVVGVDTNSCLCVDVIEGDTITLDTNAGPMTAVFPGVAANAPISTVILVAEDGSTYSAYQGGNLSALLKSSLVPQPLDNCQFTSNANQLDSDGDRIGDVCDITADDLDGDGVLNAADNCPASHNPDQQDFDTDGSGNVCDTDNDNDGLTDVFEVATLGTNPFAGDSDNDGLNDGQEDFDFDGISNIAEQSQGSNALLPDTAFEPGLNLFSYPVQVPPGTTAYSLLTFLGGEPNVDKIQRYNAVTGQFDAVEYLGGVPSGADFPVLDNVGYLISMKQGLSKWYIGSLVCGTFNLDAGINVVGLACIPPGGSAFEALTAFGGPGAVAAIQRFNRQTGRFESATFDSSSPAGVDFPLVSGEAYIVHMITTATNAGFALAPPAITLTSHFDGQTVNEPVITIEGQLSEVTSQVSVNGIFATVSNASGTPGFVAAGIHLSEGANAISIIARGANNLTATRNLTITLATPPVVSVTLPANGQTTHDGLYKVIGTVSDPGSTVDVNGVAAVLNGNSFSAQVPLTLGANTVLVTATGSNSAVATTSVAVNYQPVEISITAGSAASGAVDFLATSAVLGQVGGRTYSYSLPSLLTFSDTGQTTINPNILRIGYSIGVDVAKPAGVYSFTVNYQFRDKDNTALYIFEEGIDFIVTVVPVAGPPTVTITSHIDGQTVYATPVTLTGTVSDSAATVTVNGLAANVVGNSYSVSLNLLEGLNSVTVMATNSFGSNSQVISLTLNTTTVPADVSVAVGGSGSATHDIVTTPVIFSQIAAYNYSVSVAPAFLNYTDNGVTLYSPDTVRIGYTIDASAAAAPGTYTLLLTYNFYNSSSVLVLTQTYNVVVEVAP